MEHFWRELRTLSEFGRCVGKEIEGRSDSGARMKCLSVSDFQVSERLANKANPSLLHRGLFGLLFVRAGKWGEVKSKHAEPGKKQNEAHEGFPSSSALPLFFIFPVFRLSRRFSSFPPPLKEPLQRREKLTPFPGSTLFSRWRLRRPWLFFPSSQNLNGSKNFNSQ